MTNTAESNKVFETIGFHVPFYSILSKLYLMMNLYRSFAYVFLSCSAVLAGMPIPNQGQSAVLFPAWATYTTVGMKRNILISGMFLTYHSNYSAFRGAKSSVRTRRSDFKRALACFAYLTYSNFHRVYSALFRTKGVVRFHRSRISCKFFSTLETILSNLNIIPGTMKFCSTPSLTCRRAVFRIRIGSKTLTTNRAFLLNFGRAFFACASLRTALLIIVRWRDCKCATTWACFLNRHSRDYTRKMSLTLTR